MKKLTSMQSTIAPIIVTASSMTMGDSDESPKLTVEFEADNTADGYEFVKDTGFYPILSERIMGLGFGATNKPSFTFECNEWQMVVVGENYHIPDMIARVIASQPERIKWDKRKAIVQAIMYLQNELEYMDRVEAGYYDDSY